MLLTAQLVLEILQLPRAVNERAHWLVGVFSSLALFRRCRSNTGLLLNDMSEPRIHVDIEMHLLS